ncbi:unnamed protein product [Cuscuta campestris]|uniref:Uncharacterized protein n=1 Tax=Cuscuta campestris TaxID=132261 RepID=A0A484KW64_9ASTE|nr:unnamed protein product [Cuscuta campestris]
MTIGRREDTDHQWQRRGRDDDGCEDGEEEIQTGKKNIDVGGILTAAKQMLTIFLSITAETTSSVHGDELAKSFLGLESIPA